RHNRDEIETFLESDEFVSPQGLDFTPDGTRLFMADYAKGVFIIDLFTRKYSLVLPPPNTTMLGIDGLYFYENSLIATQNGVTPNRVVRFPLNASFTHADGCEVIEANNPLFEGPTLGVLAEHALYFVANSQWDQIDDHGQ